MNIRAFISRHSALAVALVIGAAAASAQGYYDDDIYFDASKASKERKENANKATRDPRHKPYQGLYYFDGAEYVPWNNVGDYQAADTYAAPAAGRTTRDIDEYNRRTAPADARRQQAAALPDSITLEQFEQMSATRNLARFHDSEVAKDAYTDNAIDDPNYYYAQQGADGAYMGADNRPINVNVYTGYPYDYLGWGYPYGYGYYSSYYYNPWAWGPSHYYPSWGYPSYGWGYDPYWSWGWGPSWGPSWSWGWGGGWGYPGHWGHNHWGYPGYPVWGGGVAHNRTSSGAWAPNRATASSSGSFNRGNGGVRGNGAFNTSSRGSMANSAGVRGGAAGAVGTRGSQQTATVRPGYRTPTYNPSAVTGGSTGTRGRAGYGTSGTGATYNPSSTKSSGSSWNSNSGSSRGRSSFSSGSSSSGSWSSGSSGSSRGSSGGGSFGGGGGATRGRGR